MSSRGRPEDADPWLADSSSSDGEEEGAAAGSARGSDWERQWDDEWGGEVAPPPPYEEQRRGGGGGGSQRGAGGMGRFGFLRKQIAQRLTEVVDRVGNSTIGLTEGINRSALSAGELLTDSELRSKGADVVISGAQATLQDLKKSFFGIGQGLSRGIQGASRVAASGPKQIQAVMGRVQHRIQQQRLRAMLRAVKDDLVDVQIGPQLYEDAPQELRSRLWFALVQNPGLGMAAFASGAESGVVERLTPGAIDYLCRHPITPKAASGSSRGASHNPFQRTPRSSALAASAGAEELHSRVRAQLIVNMSDEVLVVLSVPEERERDRARADDPDEAAEVYRELLEGARLKQPKSGRNSRRTSADEVPAAASGPSRSASDARSLGVADVNFLGEWDVVQSWEAPPGEMFTPPRARRNASAYMRQMLLEEEGAAEAEFATEHGVVGDEELLTSPEARRRLGGLLSAMWELQWPIPAAVTPDSRYATLLQISIGQEDVDEVITRDIHRTFPEHPQFGLEEEGQTALFNVLKAYSLHDLEVGYCQGMAFVAGILLMYLPEEPAFQAFCLLMAEDGPNLRRYYLPGLEGLKSGLAVFENLLNKFHFGIANHLKEHGIPSVLYASQWFLTAFACPLPPTFCARLIDVMLADNSDIVLMRAAMAIMAECEVEVVGLDDFEAIITHLKVEPCNWGADRMQEVLNVAVHSYLAEEDIQEAARAVAAEAATAGGAVGRSPNPSRSAAADETAEAPAAALSPQCSADLSMLAGDKSAPGTPATLSKQPSTERIRDNIVERSMSIGSCPGHRRRSSGELQQQQHTRGPSWDEAGDPTQDLAAQLEGQQSDMNEEYMAMVLALDMMLGPEDDEPPQP